MRLEKPALDNENSYHYDLQRIASTRVLTAETDNLNQTDIGTTSAQHEDLEQIQTQLMELMTHFSYRPCPHLARRIGSLFDSFVRHPQSELFPTQREHAARLARYWQMRCSDERPVVH